MSKYDILPRFECQNSILNVKIRYSAFDLRLFGLFVSSSSWCLGRAAAYDCGTPWTFLLPFFQFECQNRISNVKIQYSASIRMSE